MKKKVPTRGYLFVSDVLQYFDKLNLLISSFLFIALNLKVTC